MVSILVSVGRKISVFVAVVVASSAAFGALLWLSPGSAGIQGEATSFPAWITQFWLSLLQGDLGPSYRVIPVVDLVVRGMATSLPIIAGALVLSMTVAALLVVVFGERVQGAGRAGRALVHSLSVLPVFLLGYLAIVVLAIPPEGPRLLLAATVVLAIGDGMLGDVMLEMQTEMERLRNRDFVWAVRLRSGPVWWRLLPHIALPLAQLAASKMAFLVGGVLVLEMVLGIQGIGLIGYKAAVHPDFVLLLTITVAATGLVAGSHLVVELLRLAVDPRARKERRDRPRRSQQR